MVLSDLDRDLLSRCLASTDGAWESFLDRYIALITHVVISTAKLRFAEIDGQLRDDMVAEILLAIVDDDYAILRRFRGQSSLGTYLVVVSRRIVARRITKLATQAGVSNNATERATDPGTEEQVIDDSDEVQSLMKNLPESEATAIRMFHLEHRTYSDIGSHMGIPENSVGPLLSKARHRLRGMRR